MRARLSLALPKGRIFPQAVSLLRRSGLLRTRLEENTRQLIHEDEAGLRVLILRNTDVPTYVEHGAADLGIVGKDILLEQGRNVYEPLDLGLGRCRLVVAAPKGTSWEELLARTELRVATKFPRIAQSFFAQEGLQVHTIQLYGSLEIAPAAGLADAIVDLVDTGATLRAHGLVALQELLDATARLIVNRASQNTKHEEVSAFIARLKEHLPR
ncbi:MAG: ATP phosphoribosyltransferase [Nitrospinota bacterium]